MGVITVWKTDYLDGIVKFKSGFERGVVKAGKNFISCNINYVEFTYDNPQPMSERDWEWELFKIGYYNTYEEYDRKRIHDGVYEREMMKYFRKLSNLKISLYNYGRNLDEKFNFWRLLEIYMRWIEDDNSTVPCTYNEYYNDNHTIVEVEDYGGEYKLYIYVRFTLG